VLLIVKGDVDGTAEAVARAVAQLGSPLVGVRVIHQVSKWSCLSTAGGTPPLGYPAGRVV
jgi:hypothetical protein